MTLVSQAEFARMCEVSRKTVTMWRNEQKLVLQGKHVDVEATKERMKRYHRVGSPVKTEPVKIVTPESSKVTKSRPRQRWGAAEGNKTGNKSSVLTTVGEVETQLLALDWTQDFDWSPEALDQRVRLAAQCIGWEAVTSQAEDDGHWGGYQLRIPAYMADGLHYGAIAGGFGFELDAFDVLCLVREHISVRRDADGMLVSEDDEPIQVQPDLLSLLARPFGEMHARKD